MIADWVLLLVSLGYAGALFAVAWAGDRRPLYPTHTWLRPIVYSLALAVYCSSWTFYGAVGSAATRGALQRLVLIEDRAAHLQQPARVTRAHHFSSVDYGIAPHAREKCKVRAKNINTIFSVR